MKTGYFKGIIVFSGVLLIGSGGCGVQAEDAQGTVAIEDSDTANDTANNTANDTDSSSDTPDDTGNGSDTPNDTGNDTVYDTGNDTGNDSESDSTTEVVIDPDSLCSILSGSWMIDAHCGMPESLWLQILEVDGHCEGLLNSTPISFVASEDAVTIQLVDDSGWSWLNSNCAAAYGYEECTVEWQELSLGYDVEGFTGAGDTVCNMNIYHGEYADLYEEGSLSLVADTFGVMTGPTELFPWDRGGGLTFSRRAVLTEAGFDYSKDEMDVVIGDSLTPVYSTAFYLVESDWDALRGQTYSVSSTEALVDELGQSFNISEVQIEVLDIGSAATGFEFVSMDGFYSKWVGLYSGSESACADGCIKLSSDGSFCNSVQLAGQLQVNGGTTLVVEFVRPMVENSNPGPDAVARLFRTDGTELELQPESTALRPVFDVSGLERVGFLIERWSNCQDFETAPTYDDIFLDSIHIE